MYLGAPKSAVLTHNIAPRTAVVNKTRDLILHFLLWGLRSLHNLHLNQIDVRADHGIFHGKSDVKPISATRKCSDR